MQMLSYLQSLRSKYIDWFKYNNISWLSFKNVKFEKVGEPTKIAGITEKAAQKAAQKAIFNAAGQQMKALQKGINIVGGQKVYVK